MSRQQNTPVRPLSHLLEWLVLNVDACAHARKTRQTKPEDKRTVGCCICDLSSTAAAVSSIVIVLLLCTHHSSASCAIRMYKHVLQEESSMMKLTVTIYTKRKMALY